MDKYEQRVFDAHPKNHKKVKKILSHIPDQRLFRSRTALESLKPWNEVLIWKTLNEELTILDNSEARGYEKDLVIYSIIKKLTNQDITPNLLVADIDSIEFRTDDVYHKPATQKPFRYYLTNFMATYPTLSYVLVYNNNTWPLGIAGNHLAILKEVGTSNQWAPHEKAQLFAYSTNVESLRFLLSNVDMASIYEELASSAGEYKNKQLLVILWEYLSVNQRNRSIVVNVVLDLDMVKLYKQIVPKGTSLQRQ